MLILEHSLFQEFKCDFCILELLICCQAFVAMVKSKVNFWEDAVEKADSDMGAVGSLKKALSSFSVPFLSNVSLIFNSFLINMVILERVIQSSIYNYTYDNISFLDEAVYCILKP